MPITCLMTCFAFFRLLYLAFGYRTQLNETGNHSEVSVFIIRRTIIKWQRKRNKNMVFVSNGKLVDKKDDIARVCGTNSTANQ